ncbi:PREDICTED: flap endonuclease GEN-like 1 [Tarenaya hassleriana]|uniref:flap endonuclease GEN-like 1 n=1 Tax=Tarenaya hassleriana TaxID=28532 RepID=UPI00053C824B|nr:PREDICTED: flap endonuclease GEN-like 1 [Tarenaya hassleriana]
MGVGGKFWDFLKPYARHEGLDSLRDKRVAVDLSFWIVQHATAVKGFVRKPHLRLTFFRTINLFSKFGAYPVFVVDGTPSPLKSPARIARFFRCSGIDVPNLPVIVEGVSVERNKVFSECVRECVELLELLGMPVIQAKGEAEALCAQLNSDGHVDACITPDSDAFLFGAKCVIKSIKPNSREPFECYHMSDIEAGLGLKRKHFIAISLLVGNDYDLCGVQGIGVDTAVCFVRDFCENEILERLHDIGKGLKPSLHSEIKSVDGDEAQLDGRSQMKRSSHCSYCGHPGNKRTHLKFSCEDCSCSSGCIKKPSWFRCGCSFCCEDRNVKELKKIENLWIKVCDKITLGPKFPNDQIIELYLCGNSRDLAEDGCSISFGTPNTEMVVDFLVFKLRWEPSYVRKMMLPMLSTLYLRERARNPSKPLLYDQYEFHSIQCIKTRYGHQSFVVRWRKNVSTTPGSIMIDCQPEETKVLQDSVIGDEEPNDPLDGLTEPQVHDDGGDCFLLTDECIGLVQYAFPDEADCFLREKELQESKRKSVPSLKSELRSPRSIGVQQSITDFYRSKKAQSHANPGEGSNHSAERVPNGKRSQSSSNLSKSVRRRLLFG